MSREAARPGRGPTRPDPAAPTHRLIRWAGPLAAGLACFLVLALAALFRYKYAEAGISALLGQSALARPVRMFAARFALTLLLPFYLFAGLILWGPTLAWASAFRRGFATTWRPVEGFLLTLSALAWVHFLLWWEVPATLWLLPGLRQLPFWVLLPVLLSAGLGYPVQWVRRQGLGRVRAAALLGGWLGLWALLPWAPTVLPRLLVPARGGAAPARILIIGLDGLREDVGQAATGAWTGTAYPDAYTVIPATRLLWHILWGGDPLFYTIGHAAPALEEYDGSPRLPLVDKADRLGWKPRFYIDDGGTIGLIGRQLNFDDLLMPAPGWENFVNSNVSGSFPLFAAWENWGRAFPTTNPWAPLDAGLREALRLGRGSQWVMFHSCLAHQPIFPRRAELARIPRWWTLTPRQLEPYVARQQVTPERAAGYDPRQDPFHIYTIRMQAILEAWRPIWNGLARDPMYRGATRILFSDHGERFYHVTDAIQLGGVHGFNLDPWETRIMLKVAGPGFDQPPGAAPHPATVSVLSLRDGIGQALQGRPITPETLERAYPEAPMRYHSLSLSMFMPDQGEYRDMAVEALVNGTGLAPDGIWFTRYDRPAAERAEQVSLAWGRGGQLEVIRPLKTGGARRFLYDDYTLTGTAPLTEAAYRAEKARMIQVLTARVPGS